MVVSNDENITKFKEIFLPEVASQYEELKSGRVRFAYYTSSATAISIIKNQQLWFRNVTVMNDFSEIDYGIKLVGKVFSGPQGARFRETLDDMFDNTIQQLESAFEALERDWRFETYIACISVHSNTEDHNGRLSMWRAYGDTALVINSVPMQMETSELGVYSLPVLYLSEEDMTKYISDIIDRILVNRKYLISIGQEMLVTHVLTMLFNFAIATKHPGFSEEKEWRLFYRPNAQKSPAMTSSIEIIRGIPQKIYKLKLADEPEIGLRKADIPSLLERVIIGPTEYPYVSYCAFVDVLEAANVENASEKVILSDIPLRLR